MVYVSLYRKYRSQTFGDLMGQDHVVRTLQNGITSGRISHAYLFTGPRGTGKTSTARLLAKALCCEKGPIAEPCNECDICRSITEGSCIDVSEMDAASESSVESVRETIVQVSEYVPAVCRYKVFIIDEVHDLSTKAFDALLKTIEEPPAHVIFVLATTEFNKLPPTIRSRCQKFEFHRGSISDLERRLEHVAKAEGIEIEPAALYAIARMADGGFRDALTLLEQAIIAAPGTKVTLQDVYDQLGLVTEDVSDRILDAVQRGAVGEIIDVLGEITRLGRDPRAIVESLLYRLADLTRIVYGADKSGVADSARQAASHELAVRIGEGPLLALRSALSEAHRTIRDISLPRLWLESELIRVSQTLPGATAKAAKPVASIAPEGQVKKQEQPSPAAPAAAVVEASISDDLTRARTVWQETLKALPQGAPIQLKLSDSQVGEFKEGMIVVEMARKVDLDWIRDGGKPGRHQLVLKALTASGGAGWRIEYSVKPGMAKKTEPSAVELPAEGQKLAQIAREVFGS